MTTRSRRRPWRPWRSKTLWAIAIAVGAFIAFPTGAHDVRTSRFRDAIRQFNRRWFNPLLLQAAGRSPGPVSRLEHRGRSSGAFRATPLLAWPVLGGFVMPMPYGTDVDWAKNLLHAGEGVLLHQGVRYRVGNPRITPTRDAHGDLPLLIAALARGAGLRHVMRVDALPCLTPEVELPA